MKGDKFLDDLRIAGITGTSLTLTGRQCALLAQLVDESSAAVNGDCVPLDSRLAAAVAIIQREVMS